jgi:hypothetical protein
MLVDTVLFLILALPPAVAQMGQGMPQPPAPPPSPASTGPGARGSGQEPMMRHFEEIPPGLRERLLLCSIAARIIEAENTIAWESDDESVTTPGRPVALKLVGDNVVMALQFIPYLRQPGQERGRSQGRAALGFLVAQGQIWANKTDGGIHHQAVMQTIPFNFGEKIYFFPLGDKRTADESLIEIQLELTPYSRDISQDARRPAPPEPPPTP